MWVELPAAEACAADVGSATSQGCEQLTVEARFLADEVEGVGGHRALFRGSVRGGVGKHGHLHDGPCQLRRPVQRGHRQRHSVDREQVFTPPPGEGLSAGATAGSADGEVPAACRAEADHA